jgi:hypothetical protein
MLVIVAAVSPIDPGNVTGDLSFTGPISKDGAY